MTHLLFIKRIRQSSLLSFILPLIAINLCWILYFYLGNLDTHRNISWNDKLTVVSHKEFYSKDRNLLNCPEYSFEKTYKLDNGKKIKETIETKIYNLRNNEKSGVIDESDFFVIYEITKIENSTGTFKRGYLEAELDIKDDLWFFKCHFKKDPVMPGCLGLDAMWQLVGFYLGWIGEPGKGRALGVNSVRFTGEVLKKVKMATYEINMKRILKKEGAVVGLANGILSADGKIIYRAENLKVGLFK